MKKNILLPELESELLKEVLSFYKPGSEDEMWLVGGSIRDLVNGCKTVLDLDLAVSFDPVPLAREYSRKKKAGFVVLDDERQVVRVVKTIGSKHYNIDIARFRAENIDADLRARDFTINAMAAKIELPFTQSLLEVYDPLGGFDDLLAKRIKPCSDKLFTDDPLRIMRAFRFAAVLNAKISESLLAGIIEQSSLLAKVSGERIRDEFFKVLNCERSASWIRLMQQTGVLMHFLPELTACVGVEQNEWHHLDVYEHSLLVLENLELLESESVALDWWESFRNFLKEPISAGRSYLQVLKLGCLLHDIGKPACKKEVEKNGRVIFHGHEMEGVRMCKEIAERLKLSVSELHFLQKIIKNHMRPGVIQQQGITDKRLFKYYSETGRDGVAIALLSLADRRSALGNFTLDDLAEFTEGIFSIMGEFYKQLEKPRRPPLLTGADLINEFKLKPGPKFRELLDAVAEGQYIGEINSRDEAIKFVKSILNRN
ncbi:MAG: HD domain-containing protein [Candidatus Rifleibacteriota bacterium]